MHHSWEPKSKMEFVRRQNDKIQSLLLLIYPSFRQQNLVQNMHVLLRNNILGVGFFLASRYRTV